MYQVKIFYSVAHILPAMNPSVSNYKRDKDKKMISEIFSVADDTFGLVMLYNESNVWTGATTTVTKENSQKKKLLDSKSGRKDGWTEEGKIYSMSCVKRSILSCGNNQIQDNS